MAVNKQIMIWFDLLGLTPLSAIFQLYHAHIMAYGNTLITGTQRLDPLFPVDPPFSTKLNFIKFIFSPLNTCIKHKGKKQMATKFVLHLQKISLQAQNIQIFI